MALLSATGSGRDSAEPRFPAELWLRLGATALLLAIAWYVAVRFYGEQMKVDARANVMDAVVPYGSALAQSIDERIAVMKGVAAFATTNGSPHLPKPEFEAFAAQVMAGTPGLLGFVIAPAGVVTEVYPAGSFDNLLEADSLNQSRPLDVEGAVHAAGQHAVTLSIPPRQNPDAPVWIAWLPVYSRGTYWGLVGMALDPTPLFGELNLGHDRLQIQVAVRDNSGRVIHGLPDAFDSDPVVYEIRLPDDSWQLAGVPVGGWPTEYGGQVAGFGAMGLLVIAMVLYQVYGASNKEVRLAAAVAKRTQEVTEINKQLLAAGNEAREAQRTLFTLMSNLPGMAYRGRPGSEARLDFVSEGCLDLTGYHPDELTGDGKAPYRSLISPEDAEAVERRITAALSERLPFQLTYRIGAKDGSFKWVMEQGQGVYSVTGAMLALEGFVLDISDRMAAYQLLEQRVADRTHHLRALYDVTSVASSSLNLEQILDSSLERILAVVQSAYGVIHLTGEKPGTLAVAAQRADSHLPGVPQAERRRAALLARAVDKAGVAVLVPGPDGEPASGQPAGNGSLAYAGVPILAKDERLGVLGLFRQPAQPFTAEEASLLASLGEQLGGAVQNARLFAQSQGKAVLEERNRIASELHDSVTQLLYGLTLMAEAGRRFAASGNQERLVEYLERLAATSQQALKEMRLLVYELRPLGLEQEGLAQALANRLDAVEKRAGLQVNLSVDGDLRLPPALEDGLYRIALEALNNSLKHAMARSVHVRLREEAEAVVLEIEDDGIGFDPSAASRGMGVRGMRERAARLGLALAFDSQPGLGTIVRITARRAGSRRNLGIGRKLLKPDSEVAS